MNMIANSNQVVPQVPQDSVPPPKDRYISYFVAPLKTNSPRSRFDRFMDKLYIIIANLFRLDAADNHLRRYLDKNFDLFRKSYEDLMGLALNNSDKFGDLTSSHIEALFERFIIDMILDDETVKESVKESVRDNILNNDNPLSTLNEYDGVLDFAKLLFQRKCYTSGDEITNYLKTQYHCGNIWDFDFTPEQQLNLFIEALLHYENLCTASMLKLEGETLKSVESLKMIPVEGSNAYTIPCIKTGEKYSEFVEVLCFPEVPDSIRSSTYPTFKRRIDLLNGALTEHLLFAIEQYKEANKNGENITKPLEIDDSIFDFYADIIKEPNTLPDENEVRGIYLESCNKVSNLLVEFKKLNGNYIKIQSILKDLENNNELINISKINTVEELNKSLELIIKIDEIKVKLKDLGCELQVSEIDYTRVISLIKDYYENNYPIISQNVRTLSDTSFNTLKKVCSNEVCSNEVCSNGSINDLCVDNDDSQSNHSGSTNNTKNEESLNNDKFERLEEKLDLLKVNPEDLKKLGFVKVSETYENINFIYDVNLDIQEDCFHLNAVVNIIHASRQQKNKHDEYVQQLNSYIEGSKFMRFQDLQAVYDFHKTLNYGGNKDSYELLTGLLENAFCTLLTQDLEANEYYKIISLYSNFAGEKFDLFEINSHLINNSIIELYNALCGINQKFSATVSTAIDKLITNLPAMIKVKILEYVLDNNDIKEFSGKHLVMLNSLYHNSDRETMINNFCKNKLSFDDSCNVVINKLSKVLEGIEDAEIKKNCLFTLLEFLQIYNKKDRSLDYKLLMKLPFYVTQQLGLIELIINVNNVINKVTVDAIKNNEEGTLLVNFANMDLTLKYFPRDCEMSIKQFIDFKLIDSLCNSNFMSTLFDKLFLSPNDNLETKDKVDGRYMIKAIINCNMPLSAILELINASSVSSSNFIRAISDYCNDPKNSNMISRLENVLNNDKHLTIDKDLLLTIKTAVNNGFNLITKVIPAKNQHLKKVDYITEKNLMIFDGPFADILLDQTNISIAFEFMNQDLTTRVKLQLNSTNKLTKELNESLIFFVEMNINKILKIEDLSQDTASVQKLRMAFYLLRLASNDEKLAHNLKEFFFDENIDFELSSYIAFITDYYKQESSPLHDYMKSVANQLLCTDPNELAKTKDNIVLAMTALASNINAKGDNDRYLQVFCALFNKQLNKTLKPNDIKTKDKKEIQAVISMLQALSVVCRAEA